LLNNKSLLVLILQLSQTVLVASTAIYITHLLGVQDYGKYVYLITITSLLPLFLGLGAEHVFIMKASNNLNYLPVLFGNALFIRAVLTAASLFISALLLIAFSAEDFWIILLIITGSLLAVFANPLFLSFYRVKGLHTRPWLIGFISPITFLLYLILIRENTSKLELVSLGFCFSHAIALIIFLVDIRKFISPKINFSLIKKHFKLGLVFSFSQGFDYAFSRIDIFLLQFALGPAAVGVYAAAQKLTTLVQVIPSSFHIVELPEFHRLSTNANLLTKKFRSLRLLLLELGILFFGVIVLNAEFIIKLLFSEEFNEAAIILKILSFSGLVLFLNYPYYMLAEAINKVNDRMYMRISSFFVTISIVYLFVKILGTHGAAIGLIIGQLIFMFLLHIITRKHNGGFANMLKDYRIILLAIPAFFSGLFVKSLFENGFASLILNSGSFLFVFILSARFYGGLEIFQMITTVLKKDFSMLLNKK
jgi:O-antigen/teichoic acid export membrane protein